MWELRECAECRLIYTAPPPAASDILQYYPPSYLPYNPAAPLREGMLGGLLRQFVMAPYRLRFGNPNFTLRPFGGGKLLDIGCGAGRFLKVAADLGWRCWGIDISPEAIAAATRHVPQATLRLSTLEEFDTDQRFDVIAMSHVLEHVSNPAETLRRCRDLLAPGGRLLIGIPNIKSWEAKLFGRYWTGLDVPRHLVHFPEDVLCRMLVGLGFSVTVRPAMFASSISESLIFTLPEAMRRRLFGSRAARWLYLATVFPAAAFCLLGNRGIIEIVAARPQ